MDTKAVVAFIPVLHRGYLDFLKESGASEVYVLEASDVPELPRFERELRALRFEELAGMLAVYGFSVRPFKGSEKYLRTEVGELLMPDEDITRAVYAKNFQGRPVRFVQTFLRWDWNNSVGFSSNTPEADRVIRKEDIGAALVCDTMKELFRESQKSSDWWRQVAGLVATGTNVLLAYNKHLPHEYAPYFDGDPRNNFGPGEYIEISTALHAERGIIAEAARKGIALEGADLYVTTFPCSDCANQIAVAGIKRVFFAGGYSNLNGVKTLRDSGVELIYVEL